MAATNQERELLERLFRAAVAAVEPARLVRSRLFRDDEGEARLRAGTRRVLALTGRRLWMIAAGKAAPAMASEAAQILGPRVAGGMVAAPPRPRGLPRVLHALGAGHPLPDRGSLAAGRAAWTLLSRVRADACLPGLPPVRAPRL